MKTKKKTIPGTPMYTGTVEKNTEVKHIKYSQSEFSVSDKVVELDDHVVDWISIEGLSDVETIKNICESYKISTLVTEDILNVNQRLKIEYHKDYMFMVAKYPYLLDNIIKHDYISIVLFKDKLLTFSESNNRFIEDVVSRIENKQSKIRNHKQDYLLYVIVDMLIDESIEVHQKIQTEVVSFEEDLLDISSKDQVILYGLRKELLFLRTMTNSFIEDISPLIFKSTDYFSESVIKYYEDVHDHVKNLNSRVLMQLDNVKHILDVYINTNANKMNQIMTTLTIFSAIFIPLSFLAGVFGMNFTNFEVLSNPNGLLYFLIVCLLTPIGMLIFFRRRNWF